MEKNKVIELLPDREANGRRSATLSRWLEQYPSIEIVSRDRSSTYASAITKANEDIVQTGDVPLLTVGTFLIILPKDLSNF